MIHAEPADGQARCSTVAALGCRFRQLPAALEGDALFVAILAAIETMARLNRRLPVRAVASPFFAAGHGTHGETRAGLREWPHDARRCTSAQARQSLAPFLDLGSEPAPGQHLLLTLSDEHAAGRAPSEPGAQGRAAVHVACLVREDELLVEVRCADDDPWRRMKAPAAEIFAELLRELLVDPLVPAIQAQGIAQASRRAVLGPLAGSARDTGPFRALPHLIERRADLHPGRPALTYGGRTLTYGRFDGLANELAAQLAARGVGKGDVVPVVLDNGLEMPIAYHALMKLGAAFVPLDAAWPAERTKATLGVLAPKAIVCAGAGALPGAYRDRALAVAADRLAARAERPGVALYPDDVVYGIFTSGTTGTPKCAMNKHAGLANRFAFMTRHFGVTDDEVVLQNSKHTFDSSVWQLFWPLTIGARTVIPAHGEFLNLEHTIATIAAHGITMTDFVPSIFDMMVSIVERDASALRAIASLRRLIVGGEEMNPQMVAKLQALLPGVAVTNGYGPTEASIGMVFHTVSAADGDAIPLGRPIDNCYALVVDDERHLLPQGAVGEIAIGGVCLGSGYFADPERTAELFVSNPYPAIPGEHLYRTGDLGFFDERGRLFFLGRKDFQVKICGVRIELGELEVVAENCPHVRTAKVLVTQREAEKALAVFAAGDPQLTEAALREHMRGALPRTSLPRHYFVLPELPLTDNGKVDRRALQALLDDTLADHAVTLAAAAAPVLALDRVLHVFRSVLQSAALAADDDFIAAGGNSIQALAAVQRLSTAFGVALGAQDLFDNPTALAMCRLLDGGEPGTRDQLEDEDRLMERDAAVPAGLSFDPGALAGRLETVLLTGATGFVGSRILYELLTRTTLRVICLCRAPDDAQALRRVIASLAQKGLWQCRFAGRFEAFAADLARERLALAPPVWDDLARRCDLILHNGALVNFLFDYRAHRAANVLGTHELLRLAAAARPKPLHYVSTLGVLDCEAVRRTEPLPETCDPADAVTPGSGYSRSKWVAERCLVEARRRGAAVTVFRLGEIMPGSDNGHPNHQALTHFLLSAFHRLGICPNVSMRSDYTPVDYAAARVVAGVSDRSAWGRTLHVFHPESVCFTDVLARIGTRVGRVTCTEFLAQLDRTIDETPERELVTLRALLPQAGQDEHALQLAFARLLTDNPRLFRKDACRQLERRWGLADEWLNDAIGAYRGYLVRDHAHAG